MTLGATEFVAWWGAVLATVVFAWDIIKWRRDRPRVRVTVKQNVFYDDSERVPLPDDGDGGTRCTLKPSFHIELRNIGTQPTTLLDISSERKDGKTSSGYASIAFREHFGKRLPYMLTPGDIWSCRIDQATLLNLPGATPIEIHFAMSHLAKPLVKKLMPS